MYLFDQNSYTNCRRKTAYVYVLTDGWRTIYASVSPLKLHSAGGYIETDGSTLCKRGGSRSICCFTLAEKPFLYFYVEFW